MSALSHESTEQRRQLASELCSHTCIQYLPHHVHGSLVSSIFVTLHRLVTFGICHEELHLTIFSTVAA